MVPGFSLCFVSTYGRNSFSKKHEELARASFPGCQRDPQQGGCDVLLPSSEQSCHCLVSWIPESIAHRNKICTNRFCRVYRWTWFTFPSSLNVWPALVFFSNTD